MSSSNLLSVLAAQGQDQQTLRMATVTGYSDPWFWVQGSGELEQVRCAASCLVRPDVGDTVLVCSSESGRHGFVLSVLVQANPMQGQLQLPGGAVIEAGDGDMKLKGRSLSLQSTQTMQLQSPVLNIRATEAQAQVKHLTGWFHSIDTHALRLSATAKVITTLARRVMQRVGDSLRWVEQVDQTHAGRVRTKVAGHFHVQSRHATMRSEGHVRIDGEKIDLG
jgi:hypothetical protein